MCVRARALRVRKNRVVAESEMFANWWCPTNKKKKERGGGGVTYG